MAALAFLLILIGIFFLLFRRRDFSLTYKIDGFDIKETYQKENNVYFFEIAKENETYHTILTDVNFFAQKIIYHIEEYQEKNETCLKIHSNKSKFSPLCIRDSKEVSLSLTSDEMKNHFVIDTLTPRNETYQQISIINTHYHDFYIWNYRGFYHINDQITESISLFSKDIYDSKLKLMAQVEDYLWIPNYNSEYYFQESYILNRKTGKQETWSLKEPIYFDSVILGVYQNEIYLLDKHEKVEWKINPQTKKMTKVGTEGKGGIIYENGWKSITMNKLLYQDVSFVGTLPIDYQMNGAFTKNFSNASILIRENVPNKVVGKTNDAVYYLVGDTLYSYTDTYGEVPLLSYFEWNFNNENVIFIF